MNAVFADTSLLIAFVSEKDELHAAAAEFIRSFEGRIVTTDWVLLELGNYLAKSKHRTSFLPFLKQLRDDDRFGCNPILLTIASVANARKNAVASALLLRLGCRTCCREVERRSP